MAYTDPGRGGWSSGGAEIRPHAYDPYQQPELFRGVLTRRMIAFLIDLLVLAVPVILAVIFIAVFGLVTLGLGWALFWLVSPASVIWAIVYYGATIGGPNSATIGMRIMDLELRTWYGAPGYFVLGAVHAVCFWISVSVLSPFVLGTVVISTSVRAQRAQPARTW
ncbi:RDD family protein [Bradyrhizobium sp.]|uniref:RDD family protein n=1 Tax=Bradyrhizobium sp. TaxID=376 RepID=UPI002902075B|nr:RDD family protein [Bradyrhizobium sp.]MDU3045178.1 RDD family protein [Bradyrhizobium sp.]